MKIVGYDLEALTLAQRPGDDFDGCADGQEQRGVIGQVFGDGLGDGFLFRQLRDPLGGVVGLDDAGRQTGAAVMPDQKICVAKVLNVAADRLRRNAELIGKGLDRYEASSPGHFEDGLSALPSVHPLNHLTMAPCLEARLQRPGCVSDRRESTPKFRKRQRRLPGTGDCVSMGAKKKEAKAWFV